MMDDRDDYVSEAGPAIALVICLLLLIYALISAVRMRRAFEKTRGLRLAKINLVLMIFAFLVLDRPASSSFYALIPNEAPAKTGGILLCTSLLFAVLMAAYSPALRGTFLGDDDAYISQNDTLSSLHGLHDIWLKPGSTPFSIIRSPSRRSGSATICWGLNPLGYHVS